VTVNIGNHDGTILWEGVYSFALSDYPDISRWELKKLLAFMRYEKAHGRETEIVCDNAGIMLAVEEAIARPATVADAVIPEKITECTACKQKGCLTEFVCHTAEIENAKKIFAGGKLLSALKASGKPIEELIADKRNGAGDPEDYFAYIMFSWGNCIAGDSLATERAFVRRRGRLPSQKELDKENKKRLIPGVRFYFRHGDIIKHPGYVFDGYHPAKIKDELVLADWLCACVVPEEYREALAGAVPESIADRVYVLRRDDLGIWDWSEKAYGFVKKQVPPY